MSDEQRPSKATRVCTCSTDAMNMCPACRQRPSAAQPEEIPTDRTGGPLDALQIVCRDRDVWKKLAGELRVREARMSGTLCDLGDVPSDPLEGLGVLASYYRDQRATKLRPAEALSAREPK